MNRYVLIGAAVSVVLALVAVYRVGYNSAKLDFDKGYQAARIECIEAQKQAAEQAAKQGQKSRTIGDRRSGQAVSMEINAIIADMRKHVGWVRE